VEFEELSDQWIGMTKWKRSISYRKEQLRFHDRKDRWDNFRDGGF
jgi:hypothetical protein